MLKKKTIRLAVIAIVFFCAVPLSAQDEAYNSYTPYSMYGIGEIYKQGTAYNKSMGGVGIATRDTRNINYLNPAAVTARENKSFMADFGLTSGNRYYKQKDITSANNTLNLSNFAISFPIYKSLAMYAGFAPYTSIGYEIESYETDQDIISQTGNITRTADGYGSLSSIFVGAGVKVIKGLSVGAEIDYYFGTLDKEHILYYTNTSYRSIYSGYTLKLNTFTAKFGMQYELPVTSSVTAVLGATYKLGSNFNGNVHDYEINTISSISDTTRTIRDTLDSGRVKMASELGLGISLKGGDKWTAEFNYIRSDWSDCGFDSVTGFSVNGVSSFSATVSQSFRFGFSITPNRNDIRYYRKRVTYRGGAYWNQEYYKLDGNTINTIGLTFGATLPVFRWSNGLTFAVDLGQRGRLDDNMVRERFINFHIGINIFDIWFMKQKYD